jgi:hypothetical protein
MRSEIVFDALNTKNRFILCHEAFKAIRLLHKSNTRIEDTANDALIRLAGAEPQQMPDVTEAVAAATSEFPGPDRIEPA